MLHSILHAHPTPNPTHRAPSHFPQPPALNPPPLTFHSSPHLRPVCITGTNPSKRLETSSNIVKATATLMGWASSDAVSERRKRYWKWHLHAFMGHQEREA